MDIFERIAAYGDRFTQPSDRSGLIESIVMAKDFDPPVAEQFVPGLLQCERSILASLTECWRPFDVPFEERFPSKVEPISDRLHALTADRLPVSKPSIAQFGQVRLQSGLWQSSPEHLIVAILERHRMVPDLRGKIDRPVQMLQPSAGKQLELEGLTHD